MAMWQRPALWVIDIRDLYDANTGQLGGYLDKLLDWNGGNFRDFVLAETVTRKQHDDIRTRRGLGAKTHVQIQAGSKTAKELAVWTSQVISNVSPGVCEHDVELMFSKGDAFDQQYVIDLYTILRRTTRLNPNTGQPWDHVEWADSLGATHIGRPTFEFGLNMPAMHAASVPVSLFVNDPHLWLVLQLYFGDMSPIAVYDALAEVSVPKEVLATGRVRLCVGAATEPRDALGKYLLESAGGHRMPNLGTIRYEGNYTGFKVGPVDVYSDQLMSKVGYFPA